MEYDDTTRRLDRVEAEMRIADAKNDTLRADVGKSLAQNERAIANLEKSAAENGKHIIMAVVAAVGVATAVLGTWITTLVLVIMLVGRDSPTVIYAAPPAAQAAAEPTAQAQTPAAAGAAGGADAVAGVAESAPRQ